MKHLKIIPVLVVVALLSFSVRLAEFASGVSALTGAAHAETEKPAEASAEKTAEAPQKPEVDVPELSAPPVAAAEKTEGAAPPPPPAEGVEWKAPADEDPAYTDMKMEMFEDMSKRRTELDGREKALVAREALLKAAEQELDRKYQELAKLKKEFEGLLVVQSEEEKARVASLVKIYEGMKPADAARIFDSLDLDILISVVSGMSERKLSPIMAEMNPERAKTVTIMLAEQKRLPELPSSN